MRLLPRPGPGTKQRALFRVARGETKRRHVDHATIRHAVIFTVKVTLTTLNMEELWPLQEGTN